MKKLLLLGVVVLVAGVYAVHRMPAREVPAVPDTGSSQLAQPTTIAVSLKVVPSTVQQGDPALIEVEGLTSTSSIASLTYNGQALDLFIYDGHPAALVGVDLKAKTGSYPIVLRLAGATEVRQSLVVGQRQIAEAPLGIPSKLGGNTATSVSELLSTLASENAIINSVPSGKTALWSQAFQFPVTDPVVTDPYGYTRLTGASTISHKGTDFHAPVGTPVYAMNTGVVKMVRVFRNYGNTIIVDHGAGVETLYMHLSETLVSVGQRVEKGSLISKSGDTGYAEAPHLHISVKLAGISIDPMKFMDIMSK